MLLPPITTGVAPPPLAVPASAVASTSPARPGHPFADPFDELVSATRTPTPGGTPAPGSHTKSTPTPPPQPSAAATPTTTSQPRPSAPPPQQQQLAILAPDSSHSPLALDPLASLWQQDSVTSDPLGTNSKHNPLADKDATPVAGSPPDLLLLGTPPPAAAAATGPAAAGGGGRAATPPPLQPHSLLHDDWGLDLFGEGAAAAAAAANGGHSTQPQQPQLKAASVSGAAGAGLPPLGGGGGGAARKLRLGGGGGGGAQAHHQVRAEVGGRCAAGRRSSLLALSFSRSFSSCVLFFCRLAVAPATCST